MGYLLCRMVYFWTRDTFDGHEDTPTLQRLSSLPFAQKLYRCSSCTFSPPWSTVILPSFDKEKLYKCSSCTFSLPWSTTVFLALVLQTVYHSITLLKMFWLYPYIIHCSQLTTHPNQFLVIQLCIQFLGTLIG